MRQNHSSEGSWSFLFLKISETIARNMTYMKSINVAQFQIRKALALMLAPANTCSHLGALDSLKITATWTNTNVQMTRIEIEYQTGIMFLLNFNMLKCYCVFILFTDTTCNCLFFDLYFFLGFTDIGDLQQGHF